MKRLHIDFACHTLLRTLRGTSAITIVLFVVGTGALLAALNEMQHLWHRDQHNQAHLFQLHQQSLALGRQTRVPPPNQVAPNQVMAVNELISRLNIPWTSLFDAIEEATPMTIALLSVEPDARKHLVRVQAEAKDSHDMIAYVEQLKRQPAFQDVTLLSHEINAQDANRPLRFQLEAEWMEALR